MSQRLSLTRIMLIVTALAVALTTFVGPPGRADAVQNGAAPTTTSASGAGPFATASVNVSRLAVTGFGGGVIYYPTSTAQTYGGIAIAPGFTEYWSQMSWLGPRLASHGFVVFGIDTVTTSDQPAQRGDELRKALQYLTGSSSVKSRVDATRLGVAGHSMGGGGALEAAKADPTIKAVVPLAPWNLDQTWNDVSAPTLIIGAQLDTIAPNATHSIPFYNTLASSRKSYLELAGKDHLYPLTANATVSRFAVSWFKRWLDGDTRYTQFLCVSRPSDASDFRATCPF
jgi:alpha-beta hydrolase superfamily lysophospholipase